MIAAVARPPLAETVRGHWTRRERLLLASWASPSHYCPPSPSPTKACIAGGAHYLDITGEPEFMERMEAKFSAAAKEKVRRRACVCRNCRLHTIAFAQHKLSPPPSTQRTYPYACIHAWRPQNLVVVSACGFDSIPADMGNLFTLAQFPAAAVPVSVDSFLALDSGGSTSIAGRWAYEKYFWVDS